MSVLCIIFSIRLHIITMMLIIIVILITMKAVVTTMMIIAATISAQTETSRPNEQNLQRFLRGNLLDFRDKEAPPGLGFRELGVLGYASLEFRVRVQGARVSGIHR